MIDIIKGQLLQHIPEVLHLDDEHSLLGEQHLHTFHEQAEVVHVREDVGRRHDVGLALPTEHLLGRNLPKEAVDSLNAIFFRQFRDVPCGLYSDDIKAESPEAAEKEAIVAPNVHRSAALSQPEILCDILCK